MKKGFIQGEGECVAREEGPGKGEKGGYVEEGKKDLVGP